MRPESSGASQLERLLTLKTFPAFGGLSNEDVAVIAENARERTFAAGTQIYGHGDAGRHLYYVIDGRVEVKRNGVTETEVGARGVVGGLAALAGGIAQQAIAVEETSAYEVRMDKLFEVFEDNFELMLSVLRGVAGAFVEARQLSGLGAGFDEDFERVAPPPPMTLVDRLFHLHKSLTFARTRIASLTELATWARELREPAGTVLWREGDPSAEFLLIVSGVVRCDRAGQQFRLGPGGAAGTLDSIRDSPRWFTATVEEDVVALRIEGEQLLDILEDHADMGMDLVAALSAGLLSLRDKIANGEEPPPDAP